MLHKSIQKSSRTRSNSNERIRAAQQNICKQGALAVFAVLVTVILLFAMTTAWFTNVVSAGDLTFRAESWGFDGSVSVSNEPIEAAPGDSGVVSMRIENTGDVASVVTVNISKAFMDAELQKRIFFYADTTAVVNGETVQRQYLTNAGGYSYWLFAHNELILEEQIHTDVQLKWEWVYDVVGYYFRGTAGETKFTVEEYLRPVEYVYDNAQYDSEGNLEMVDPDTDTAVFLAQLTASDGYAGAFYTSKDDSTGEMTLVDENSTAVQTTLGCYPIDEENDIWLYLCTKTDIAANTKWDTEFGSASGDASRNFQARITVTGQQLSQQVQQVGDQSALEAAWNANDGTVIQLTQDVVLTEALELQDGAQAVLDLNGNQITCLDETVFDVGSGAQLTVFNGTVKGSKENTTAFRSVGGQLTLSGVEVSDVYEAVSIDDHTTANAQGDNSVVRITGSTLASEDVTIMISGDGTASEGKTILLIQYSAIHSDAYVAIMGNGSAGNPGRWGTDIQIINSTVSGYYGGVYHPQMQSDLTISGSTVEGMTGVAIKGGNVVIRDSVITGTGTDADVIDPNGATLSNSGYLDTGDGVYVESDYGYAISVMISGNCVISHRTSTAQAVRVFPEAAHVRVQITGGTFDSDVTEYLADGYICTGTNGNYAVEAEK